VAEHLASGRKQVHHRLQINYSFMHYYYENLPEFSMYF